MFCTHEVAGSKPAVSTKFFAWHGFSVCRPCSCHRGVAQSGQRACLGRRMSGVQISPPRPFLITTLSSSGQGRLPFMQEIAGSNPARVIFFAALAHSGERRPVEPEVIGSKPICRASFTTRVRLARGGRGKHQGSPLEVMAAGFEPVNTGSNPVSSANTTGWWLNGKAPVSKTGNGGSIPSRPARQGASPRQFGCCTRTETTTQQSGFPVRGADHR